MKTEILPYLNFNGRCEEAIDYYKTALGAEVTMLMRFKDNPEPLPPGCPPSPGEKVMHAEIRIGGTLLMLSDGRCTGTLSFDGFSLALRVPAVADADRFFTALAEGGQVMMPLAKTFFSPRFGMVTDRFGLGWMVLTTPGAQ